LKARVVDQHGKPVPGAEPDEVVVDARGNTVDGKHRLRITPGANEERALTLWLLTFDQPLALYAPA
jgi:hypothetical protein